MEGISELLNDVKDLRKSSAELLKLWPTFKGYPKIFKEAFFYDKLLAVIENGDLSLNEKIEELTMRLLRILSEKKK